MVGNEMEPGLPVSFQIEQFLQIAFSSRAALICHLKTCVKCKWTHRDPSSIVHDLISPQTAK